MRETHLVDQGYDWGCHNCGYWGRNLVVFEQADFMRLCLGCLEKGVRIIKEKMEGERVDKLPRPFETP